MNSESHNTNKQKLRVGINTEIDHKIDFFTDGKGRHSLTHNFVVRELTVEELAEEIRQRHNICNPCFNGSQFHRKKQYCQSADYLAVDFDNDMEVEVTDGQGNVVRDANGRPLKKKVRREGDDYFSFEDALNDPFIRKYGSIIYPTPSDTPEWNRFRVVFAFYSRLSVSQFLKRYSTIKDETERQQKAQRAFEQLFEDLVRLFIWKFKADKNCKDCSRFFYGTSQPDRVIVLGGSLDKQVIAALRADYEKAHPKPQTQEHTAAVRNVSATTAVDRLQQYGPAALRAAKQAIETAPQGQKNLTRAKWAYTIGGYVAGGLLDEETALAELEASVKLNTDNFYKSWKTIEDCFAEGMTEPITIAVCEQRRAAYNIQNTQDDEDDAIVLPDGEIVDPNDDPPVAANDPSLETYLRKVLANTSRFTRARMYMAGALGFTKLPWRLLNAILAYERGKLGMKVISDARMLELYTADGKGSESTLKRDKKKLWEMQASTGIQLVLYVKGYVIRGVPPEPDKHFGSRYKCNLDRWTLEAIALAIQKRGKYELKDAEIKAACVEIAKQVPRCPIADEEPKKRKKTAEVFIVKKDAKVIIEKLPPMLQETWDAQDCDGFTIERDVQSLIEKLPSMLQEAWDMEGLTVGERQMRTKALMLQLCKDIMQRADVNVEAGGRRQRKRSATEINAMAAEVVTGAIAAYSPLAGYVARERTPEERHATDCRIWREDLSMLQSRHERGEAIEPMPKIRGGFLTPKDAPTDELRAEYEDLLRAAGHWPLPAQPSPEEPPELAALIDAQCEMFGEPDEQLARGTFSAPFLKDGYKRGCENAPLADFSCPPENDLQPPIKSSICSDLPGGQNDPLGDSLQIIENIDTYAAQRETPILGVNEARRAAILERFAVINRTAGALFVERQFSDEVIALAAELADLDRKGSNTVWEF